MQFPYNCASAKLKYCNSLNVCDRVYMVSLCLMVEFHSKHYAGEVKMKSLHSETNALRGRLRMIEVLWPLSLFS